MPLQLVARCFPVHVVVWSPQCPNTLTIKGFGSPLPFPTYERLVVQATTAVVGATFDSGCPNVPCRLQEDPPAGVSGAPTDNNIMIWNAVIFGPHDTPFEDGTFKLTLEFTEEYPNKPPTVRFVSKMFHPNGESLVKGGSKGSRDSRSAVTAKRAFVFIYERTRIAVGRYQGGKDGRRMRQIMSADIGGLERMRKRATEERRKKPNNRFFLFIRRATPVFFC
ncbi:unnamed protein product [Ixodes persulcatus]